MFLLRRETERKSHLEDTETGCTHSGWVSFCAPFSPKPVRIRFFRNSVIIAPACPCFKNPAKNLKSLLKPEQTQAPMMTCGLPTGEGGASYSPPGGKLCGTTQGSSLLACLKLANYTLHREPQQDNNIQGWVPVSLLQPKHKYQADVNPPPPPGVH